MREPGLKDYYERELRYLRELGKEFAEQHGEVAKGLRMEAGRWADPHVERLLEGFAFLSARVHRRIDDDFSEMSQAILNIVYPHYLRPIPSMSVVQMEVDPDQGISSGVRVEAGQTLVSPPTREGGVRCRFRSCYPAKLWPIKVTRARWQSPHGLKLGSPAREVAAVLSVTLGGTGGLRFGELELDTLRFYLDGDLPLMSSLYEILDNNCTEILVRDPSDPEGQVVRLPGSALTPVGFEKDEGMLPLPRNSFLGYRILQEYFTFPYKFLFLDVSGLERLSAVDFGDEVEVLFLMGPFSGSERQEALARGVTRDTLRLGCTPVINLFQTESEPIRLDHRRAEYLLRAKGATRDFAPQIFSVDEVEAVVGIQPKRQPLEPFFSYRNREETGRQSVFWHVRRFPSNWLEDGATDVSLAFVDPSGNTIRPEFPSVSSRLTCFNGTLPSKLPIGTDHDFHAEGGEGSAMARVVSLMHPTEPIAPPLGSSTFWRIVSQLSLNYLSLVDEGGAALREVLSLYSFADPEAGEKQIQGIVRVESSNTHARVRGDHGLSFARGRKVTVEFDEEFFSGGRIYLLASVLERFLGLYTNMNSFTQLEAKVRSRQKTYTLRTWNPRAGQKPLL
ncbi:MAG: type VI secretion system baseplate subunit TssF [Longimicrobiales bacterium]